MNMPSASALSAASAVSAISTIHTAWDEAPPAGQPRLRALRLPARGEGFSHASVWWLQALRLHLRGHRLRPGLAGRYGAGFTPAATQCEAVAHLFDLRHAPAAVDYPFFHGQFLNQLLQGRILLDLGVNAAHVQLLRHRTRLLAPAADLARAAQQLECGLQRVVRVGPTEVLLILATTVHGADGRALAALEDTLLVSHLPVADAVQADDDDGMRRAVGRLRRRVAELQDGGLGVQQRQLYIAPDAGRRYAQLSGQRHPVHGSTLAARLLGRRRPYVQPMYLRDLVARELAEAGLASDGLQLTFTRRAGLGQTLRLLRRDGSFELVDARGRLVAFGRAGAG